MIHCMNCTVMFLNLLALLSNLPRQNEHSRGADKPSLPYPQRASPSHSIVFSSPSGILKVIEYALTVTWTREGRPCLPRLPNLCLMEPTLQNAAVEWCATASIVYYLCFGWPVEKLHFCIQFEMALPGGKPYCWDQCAHGVALPSMCRIC